jgi:hypothetical protein
MPFDPIGDAESLIEVQDVRTATHDDVLAVVEYPT